jgi:hypothetical protein
MWNELWGVMQWGGAAQVPMLPFTKVLIIAVLLGVMAGVMLRGRQLPRWVTYSLGLALLLLPATAFGVPHVFTNGTVANAQEVNVNFATLENSVNQVATRPLNCQTYGGTSGPSSVAQCPGDRVATGGVASG